MNRIPLFKFNEKFSNKRNYLLNKCGLPDIPQTQHCFADGTHHTCCELSPESRKYADESGNPIGKLSQEVFEIYKNQTNKNETRIKELEKKNATPWCTCFGSKVCGYYGEKHNSNIEFISSPNEDKYAKNIKSSKGCEEHVRQKFNTMSHGTPGINNSNNNKCSSTDINKITYSDIP